MVGSRSALSTGERPDSPVQGRRGGSGSGGGSETAAATPVDAVAVAAAEGSGTDNGEVSVAAIDGAAAVVTEGGISAAAVAAADVGAGAGTDIVTNDAVVSHMSVCKVIASIADNRLRARSRATVDRDKFPKGIVVTNLQVGWLASVFEILSLLANRAKCVESVPFSDCG